MRITRPLSQCNKCPLWDQTRVWGEGPLNPDMVIIGEAPGFWEADKGHPFVGKAGQFLNIHLSRAGIMRHRCYVTNLLPCRPPGNNINHPDAVEAFKLCKAGFLAELKRVTTTCGTILTLGNAPLNALIDTMGDTITNVRGSVYDYIYLNCKVIPAFHPSYMARQGKVVKTLSVYQADLRKAKRIADGGCVIYPPKDYTLNPTFEEVTAFLTTTKGALIGADTENDSVDPMMANLICMSFAVNESKCMWIPWQKQGGGPYWSILNEAIIKDALTGFVKRNTFMFQNAIYDKRVLDRHGIVIPFKNIAHDTMILHHTVNPELLHNIGFIGSIHADVPYHKGILLNRKTRIVDMDPIQLGTYNCDDSTILHRVLPSLEQDLADDGLADLYKNERIKLIKPYINMMDRGINFDRKVHRTWVKEKTDQLNKIESELRKSASLPDTFNFSSDDDLRLFLYGLTPSRVTTAERDLQKRLVKINKYKEGGKKKQADKLLTSNVHATLLATIDFVNYVKPIYILNGYNGRTTKKSNKRSVSEENLLELRNQLNRRLETIATRKKQETFEAEKKQIRKLIQWLLQFTDLNRVNTLVKNYGKLHTHVRSDGRIHASYNIIGTRTGRPSCSEPNLLTLPKKRDTLLRQAFIPAPGFRFLSADYAGAEITAFAYITQNKKAIEAIRAGKKIHDENTKLVFHITKDDPKWKQKRNIVKQFRFGRIQYGGSDREIFRKLLIDCPDMEMTFGQFKQLSKDYFKANPEEKEWIDRQQEMALKYRITETPMGFKRRLYGSDADIKKQAINTPVQGMIAHIINRAMIALEDEIERLNLRSRMILQIYDQLVFEEWPEERHILRDLVKTTMEKPVKIYDQEVIFKVDLAVGDNFGELKELV